MYLSKLEILGFKSFAQRTQVHFNQGVTSIVGPNGCGKTNIVDAIRWALGEQRSSALRSDKMENVIFNGTSGRKPMGMAEVSLTIENSKGILPTEYSELTISRRIFRSGESEYLLNKNICRLKDITNLFMDTGMGTNAYSVIELKMVETILSNKADERRNMFEEAAGVNKYKLRRRLALRKLDEVKADLTRVNDIVTEVERSVSSLERQAKKADKYNKISSTLRELELDLAERELALFNLQRKEAKERKEENFQKRLSIESAVNKLEDELRIIKQKLNETEAELKQKRSEVLVNTEKVYNVQRHLSVAEERRKSLDKNIHRFKQELEELNAQLAESFGLIEDSRLNTNDIAVNIESKEKEKEATENKAEELKINLENKQAALKTHTDSLLERFKDITNKENEVSNLQKAINFRNQTISKLNDRIQSLTSNIAKTVGFIEELGQEKEAAELKFASAEALYAAKQKEKEEFEKELNRLRSKELEDKSIISSIKDKIEFIQGLIDNLEGVSKGVKALLEDSSWASGDKTLLAHIGNSADEFRFAVEAALRNNLNNILIETLDDLKSGIEYLRNNNLGKAAFYLTAVKKEKKKGLLNWLQQRALNKKVKAVQAEESFIGWTKDYIETEEKWKPFFNRVLARNIIVRSLEDAQELSDKFPEFNYSSLNGDYLDATGIIEAGSEPKLDDSLFGRKKLLENLKNEFPQREKDLSHLREKVKTTEELLNSIDLKVLSEHGRMLVNEIANVEKQIAQFEFEKQKAVDEIEKARKDMQTLADESNRLDNDRTAFSFELGKQQTEKSEADKYKELLEVEFKQIEEDYNLVLSQRNKINLLLERLMGEKKNTLNEIERAENSIDNIKKSIAKREIDISSSEDELGSLNIIIEEKTFEQHELEQIKSVLTFEEAEIDNRYKSIRAEITEAENKLSQFRKEREALSEEIHAAEMKLGELKIKIENLYANIQETYSLKLETKSFDDLDTFDFKQRSEEVHSFKQQIKNLGPINLLAYSEFEVESERLEFLNKQRSDLLDSEKDVVKTIEEINITAQTLFMETFNKIRENFVNIFRSLFNPGDEADLRIEENTDPLEAKIEIIAKPKGKRPTSIELLSGGEKTLTAIALLFSIYLVKPSPFCILDEIDAPLDDANIDRFNLILKQFSKDTQFIVVTHNKRTMEAANTLYGVTMQEEGISKLVSVRFNEDLNVAS